MTHTQEEIRRWMELHVESYRTSTGEVNCTTMVEAWDAECSTGEATLDEHHPAWEVVVEVAEAHTKKR